MDTKIKRKVERLLAERDEGLRPVWIRAPKPGEIDHYCALGRGKLYQIEAAGLIKSASLKPPGAVRGVKLFNLASVLKYVESCSTPASVIPPGQYAATGEGGHDNIPV